VETKHEHDYFFESALVDVVIDGTQVRRRKHEQKHEFIEKLRQLEHAGLVLFSTGTTGRPKAILHDLTLFLKRFETPRPTLRTINFLLFDHIGGINTVFYNLFSKGILVIPSYRTSDYILSLVEKYQVELLPTTPSFLNLLLLNKTYLNFNLSSLRTISYGTEPMPITTLEALNKAFPNIYFKQTYGLTEVGIIRTKSESSNSLWLKLGDESHQIQIRDSILWIKSKMSMLGYLNAEFPFDSEGWFNTKDKVEVRGEYIKILGRASELINVGGQKVFPTEIENVVLEVPGVIDVLAYGADNPIMGKVVNLKVYSKFENIVELTNQIKKHCAEKLEKFKRPIKIEFVSKSFESDRFIKKRV
jgi:acyl-CoA synthetase (AMP-forming)/AMP-acid ligase II